MTEVKNISYNKMKAEWKEPWVAALRSGNFAQAKEVLRDPTSNSFCCLGVLCDISNLGTWHGSAFELTFPEPFEYDGGLIDSEESEGELYTDTRDFFGLDGSSMGRLMTMNDDDGYSFAEIADWIEENL